MMKRFTIKLLLLGSFILGISWANANQAMGQTCPNKIASRNTIVETAEQCYNANDGTIQISFVNAGGTYDASLGNFNPVGGDYQYNLFDGGSEGGWVYDKSNFSAGLDVVPSISVSYTAPNTITFTGLPPNKDGVGYTIVIVGGNCSGSGNSESFSKGAFGIVVNAATELTINPAAITTTANTTCVAPYDGQIDLNGMATGGTNLFEYSIDGGTTYQASPVFSNIVHGTYTARVRDSNGCIKDQPGIVVNDNRVFPTANITRDPAISCANTPINLNGNPGSGTGTYTAHNWTGDTGPLSAMNVADPVFNATAFGTYNLTYEVTDSKGCTATSSITIVVNQGPTAAVLSGDAIICAGNTANLFVNITNGTAPYSFTLSDGSNITGYNSNDAIAVSPAATTTYTIAGDVTDANGCSVAGSGTPIVQVVNSPDVTLIVRTDDPDICQTESADIIVENSQNGYSYQLRNDADDSNVGTAVTGTGGDIILPTGSLTATTTFNVLVDNSTCPPVEMSTLVTVTVNPPPTSAVLSGDATICAGNPANLKVDITGGTAPYTFEIDNGVGVISGYNSGDAIAVSPAATTTYNLISNITDANGCSVAGNGTATVTVVAAPDVNLPINADDPALCQGEPTNIRLDNSQNGYSYQLRRMDNSPVGPAQTGTGGQLIFPTGNLTATTTFKITVDNGTCPPVDMATTPEVTVNPPPTSAVLSGNTTICAGSPADLIVTITGGTAPYTFEIDNGVGVITGYTSGAAITVSPATTTTYNLISNITDANGCSVTGSGLATVTVVDPPDTGLPVNADLPTVCPGTGTGILVNNSENGYSYQLRNNAGNINIGAPVTGTGGQINLPTGNLTANTDFNVLVSNGTCPAAQLTATATVNVSAMTAGATATPTTVVTGNPAMLNGTGADGSGTYTYHWEPAALLVDPNIQNPQTQNLTATQTFTLTVEDQTTRCTATATVEVQVTGGPISVTATANPETVCSGEPSQLNATGTGGSGNFSYSWDNAALLSDPNIRNPVATLTTTTTFEVTLTDLDDNSTTTAQVTVNVNLSPTAAVLSGNATICAGSPANLSIAITDGTAPYTIELNNGIGVINNYNSGDVIAVNPMTNTIYNLIGNVTDANGCSVAGSGTATVQVVNNPDVTLTVNPPNTTVCSGSSINILVDNSENGHSYQLRNDADDSNIGTPVIGTGGQISLPTGVLTADTDFNIAVDNGTCPVAELNNKASVTVSVITVSNAGTSQTICADNYTLSSNAVTAGETGEWTRASGTGIFANVNDPNTTVTGLGLGDNVFQWTISDNSGTCPPSSSDVTITRKQITVAAAGTDQQSCTDESTLAANAPAAGETGTWTIVSGTGTFANANDPNTTVTGLTAGDNEFQWTITDNAGICTATQDVVTVRRNLLTADAGANQSVVTGNPAMLNGTGSAGSGTYTYHWEPAALLVDPNIQNPQTVNLTATQTFTLTVTDQNTLCTATATVEVQVTGGPISVTATATPGTVCSGEPSQLNATGTGGSGNFTYSWDNAALLSDPNIRNPVATLTTTTTLTVTLTDMDDNSTTTATVIVDVNALPVAYNVAPATTLTLCSGQDAAITLDGSQTGVTYTLLRNGGATAITQAGTGSPITLTLSNGSYANNDVLSVRAVNDATTCRQMMNGSSQINISDPVVFNVTPAILEVCNGQDATVNLSGSEAGIAYEVLRNGISVDNQAGTGAALSFTLPDGTFGDADTLTIQANNGSCTVPMNGAAVIDHNGQDASFAYATGTFCSDGANPSPNSITTQGGTFSTDAPGSLSINAASGEINLSASMVGGPYRVYYTLINGGCTSVESVEVTITNAPDATFNYAQLSYCQSEANPSPVAGSGASFGTFLSNDPLLVVDAMTGVIDLTASTPGNYTVTNFIAASGSCLAVSYQVSVEILEQQLISSFSYNGPFCQNEANPLPTVTGTPGGMFTCPDPNLIIIQTTGRIDLANSIPGTYDITYRTPGTCWVEVTTSVTINASPNTAFTYAGNRFCQSDANPAPDNPPVTPGGTFSATPGLVFEDPTTGKIDLAASTAGPHTITYAVGGSCPGSSTFNITINEVPVANAGADDNSCHFTYPLQATVPGVGTGVWRVVSLPPAATATFSNTAAADATVTVDQVGTYQFEWETTNGTCVDNDVVEVVFSDPISFTLETNGNGNARCSTPALPGFVWLNLSGGTGPYNVLWSNGEGGTATATVDQPGDEDLDGANVPSGVYTVRIADQAGCDTVGIFVVKSDDISVNLTGSSATCNGDLGQINLEFNGTGPYNIYYINSHADTIHSATKTNFGAGMSNITDVVTDLPADLYYIHLEDIGGGCSVGDTIRFAEPAPIAITLTASVDVSCYGGSDGTIQVDVSGGTPGYTYQWYKDGNAVPTLNTEDISGLTAGSYYLEVTDGVNCVSNSPVVTITEPAPEAGPTANAPILTTVTCNTFEASWSDEGVAEYRLDVASDENFTTLIYNDEPVFATNFPVTGLDANTPYWYRVRAVKGCGPTANSNVVNVTTEAGPVTTVLSPSGVVCEAFTAHWSLVPGASYQVDVSTDAAFIPGSMLPGYDDVMVSAGTNSLDVTGLDANTTYYYRVRVNSACGAVQPSNTESATTQGLTESPSNLTATPGCDDVVLGWTAVAGVSTYRVVLDNDADFSSPAASQIVNTNNASFSGLPLGTTYYFRIVAQHPCDTTYAESTFTTEDKPAEPTAVAVTGTTCDAFTLQWNAVAGADTYTVEVDQSPLFDNAPVVLTVTGIDTTFTALAQGTVYYYRIKAVNTCGESLYLSGNTTTDDVPVAPSVPVAAAPSCNGFAVSWNAVSNATSYRVEASADDFVTIEPLIVRGTDTTFTVLNVATTYKYRVTAINACGTGATTDGAATVTTSPEEQCGCGFDKARFVINTENVNCLGDNDGALLINLLPSSTAAPSRFEYGYRSLTNPADTVGFQAGANNTGLVWAFDELLGGDYKVYIRDRNAQPGCQVVRSYLRSITVQNNITLTTKAETCEGADGAITLNVPNNCGSIDYVYVWRNEDTGDNLDYGGSGATNPTGLVAGNYQLIIQNDLGDPIYQTSVSVANNCSTIPGEPGTARTCRLGDKTVKAIATAADCDTGEGSITFTVIGGETISYNFEVVSLSGTLDRTQTATGSTTFEGLPIDDYEYLVTDASGNPSCQGSFKIRKNIPAILAPDYTLPACDAPQIVAMTIALSTDTASVPYDVYAIAGADTVSRAVIAIDATNTVLEDVPTGQTYRIVVQSRAAGTCPNVSTVAIPSTGAVDITFDYAPEDMVCFGDGGTVEITNIVAGADPLTIKLYRVEQIQPYQTKLFPIAPSAHTFVNLEKGEYQVQIEQQRTNCGGAIYIKRSPTFVVDGPLTGLEATMPEEVKVSVNQPLGDVLVDKIRGGGLPYEVKITGVNVDTEWTEVFNNNPLIDPYAHTFTGLAIGNYVVQVRDRFGCTLTQNVEVKYTDGLYVPNIFTPNGDGKNDTFQIVNLPAGTDEDGVKIVILNRLGRVLYKSNNYSNEKAWDGGDFPDGIYFYRLTLPNGGGSSSGWVEIWRGRTP